MEKKMNTKIEPGKTRKKKVQRMIGCSTYQQIHGEKLVIIFYVIIKALFFQNKDEISID